MNKGIEEYKNNFIREYIYEKRYISNSEAKASKERVYEERDGFDCRYYIKVPMEMTEEELDKYIKLKTLEKLEQLHSEQKDIKGIVFVITVTMLIQFVLMFFK